MEAPETGYARTDDGVYLAYQIVGDGPIDVLYQPDWPGNIDMEWEFPSSRAFLTGVAQFARVIMHEHRGVGLSSRNVPIPNLETRMADALTVLDTVGSKRAVLTGVLASGAVNALLAVTRPERTAGLVWLDPNPRTAWADDNPWGRTSTELDAELENLRLWGTSDYGRAFASEQASYGNPIPDVEAVLFAKASRNACTPDVAIELAKMWAETDVRSILPTIGVPTLCIAQSATRETDRARHIAGLIPGAEFREIEGDAWTVPTILRCVEEIGRFIGVERSPIGEGSRRGQPPQLHRRRRARAQGHPRLMAPACRRRQLALTALLRQGPRREPVEIQIMRGLCTVGPRWSMPIRASAEFGHFAGP